MEERVKIITPGTCDYFRKVLIPSTLGDDTGDYAPKNGAYRNAIVEYEANHALYIYSSDGIPTKIDVAEAFSDGSVTTAKIADGAVTSGKVDWATMANFSGEARRCDFGFLHIFTTVASTSTTGQTIVSATVPSDFTDVAGRIAFASCVPYYNTSGLNQTYSVWWGSGKVNAYVNNQSGTNEYRFCVIAFF